MDQDKSLFKEAADLLDQALTPGEIERLMGIRHDVNFNIHWKNVVKDTLDSLLTDIETLLFEGTEGLVKEPPIASLFPVEQDFLKQGHKPDVYQHWLVLMVTKKLLGALKTRVNKELKKIPVLDREDETDLQNIIDSEFEVEEEDDGVLGMTSRSELDDEIIARLHLGDRDPCQHFKTKIRRVKANGDGRHQKLQTYCVKCRNIVSEKTVKASKKKNKKGKGKGAKPFKAGTCLHRKIKWVAGEEGRTAECSNSNCSYRISDPEALLDFDWEAAGLEPCGDDPSQDEVIVL